MPQSKSFEPMTSLSDLCRQLSEVVNLEPLEQMEAQLSRQREQSECNIRWLEQALGLLDEVCRLDAASDDGFSENTQIIAKVESFVSKARGEGYHECNLQERSVPRLQGISFTDSGEGARGDNPKKK